MKNTLITVTAKPDHAERNRELIRAVYAELDATQPDGIHYATFELDDGVSLVHLYAEEDDAPTGLRDLAAFQAYSANSMERFTEPPIFSELHEIGSYRVFDSDNTTRRERPTQGSAPMKRVLVRYRVKPDQADTNRELLRAVQAELEATQPPDMGYAVFQLDDGLSFVHLHHSSEADAKNALFELPAFQAFEAGVRERCDEQPVASELDEIGSYRFFDSK